MSNKDFTTTVQFTQTPQQVFTAILNVRGWWSQNIEGNTEKQGDVFDYSYNDVHRSKIKLAEVVPGKKVVWEVLDNYFSFTKDKSEWIGSHIIFDIEEKDGKTELRFTHQGLTPAEECYDACVNGWTQYINHSLPALVTTGTGQPNGKEQAYTIHEIAARFNVLAQEEKWFEIQEELFADDVTSTDPAHSPYMGYAEGKANVRKKGEDFVAGITGAHKLKTGHPIVAGNHFAVHRDVDIDTKDFGRIQMNQVMLYEVKNGKIISEQFFY
jgi:ketosteroid isomerase-like protein/uncharacterized protein YndB with AHSA1/START domain